MYKRTFNALLTLVLFAGLQLNAQDKNLDPGLILTQTGVDKIQSNLGDIPLFDQSLLNAIEEVDAEIERGIEVPIPKDLAGGYTHEKHKSNFYIAQKAGVLYQITGEKKYLDYLKKMFEEYAKMYPTLPLHPEERSYSRGKIFWQALNDANWLVYMSQAYASIRPALSDKERNNLENNLFRPFADFLSVGNPQFFNRIHNHSTWGNAAVGMMALVLDDEELLNRALYGLEEDNIEIGAKDDDGGFIKQEGQEAGFIANIDQAFSPSGYYTEGPYYQRYAMYPFMIFAAAIQNKRPELKIFEHRNGVLIKAVDALLNLTYGEGDFFPLNDAQKGMSIRSRELVTSVGIAYYFGKRDPSLLSLAKEQGRVSLDDTGLAMAIDILQNTDKPFKRNSMELTDGKEGEKGGLAIIRSQNSFGLLSLLFKYTSQGDSHGHYDKLSFSLYNDSDEVLQDYGLARFVNIDQKNGGGYLKENTTWAKQSIAHNTVVQNKTSHFKGDFETGTKYHSEKHFLDFTHPEIQIVSAKEHNAYPGTQMQRTIAVINDKEIEGSLIVDIYKVISKEKNDYDLPFHYLGQVIETNFEYKIPETLTKLGDKYGYQHLWKEGYGTGDALNTKFTWLSNRKFYTLTSITTNKDSLIFARLGASDPNFNLRRDPAFIIRKTNLEEASFISVIESHGSYDPVTEIAHNAFSQVLNVEKMIDQKEYTGVKIKFRNGREMVLIVSNLDASKDKEHNLRLSTESVNWKGPFYFKSINNK